MDPRNGSYFTNLLHHDSEVFDDEIVMNSQNPMVQRVNHNVEASTQPSTQASQFSNKVRSNSKKTQRGGNFTIEEDKLIVSSWLEISLDAVQGNDQKQEAFWKRIHALFHKYKTFSSDRNPNSLSHRWSTIQLATNKFCGCYSQIEFRHQSGVTEQDKIHQAKALFHENLGHAFPFEHCWHILRFNPKWIEECEKKNPKRGNSAKTIDSVNLGDNSVANDGYVDLERPPGRKAEKERLKKRKNSDGDSLSPSPFADMLSEINKEQKKTNEERKQLLEKVYVQENDRLLFVKERFQIEQETKKQRLHIEQERVQQEQERIRQEQERIDIKQEKIRLEQLKEDERIMGMNTSGLSSLQIEFYECLQKEILKKEKEFERIMGMNTVFLLKLDFGSHMKVAKLVYMTDFLFGY